MSTIDLKDAEAYFSKLADDLPKAALRGLHSAAAKSVQEIQVRIIPSRTPQPVDRGLYRAGWKWEPQSDGADIYNDEPHAVFIEEGVRKVVPGPAMIQALAGWVVRKGLASSAESLSVAWSVAKAMQARGTIFGRMGMGIMRELLEQRIEKIIDEEVSRELRRLG